MISKVGQRINEQKKVKVVRKPIIAGNWKMNKTVEEAKHFANEVKIAIPSPNEVDVVICAPALALSTLVEEADGTDLNIGAQTMHWEKEGAFTGEISPYQLQALGVDYVIIGHSERREMFAETDETVNKKVKAAFEYRLTPIVCVGETLEERKAGDTEAVIRKSIERAFSGVSQSDVEKAVIAYEPIWAIGTGESASPVEANAVCQFIRNVIKENVSEGVANRVRIQYGGSVNENNIDDYLAESDIDGALVGGASLQALQFLHLLGAVQRVNNY